MVVVRKWFRSHVGRCDCGIAQKRMSPEQLGWSNSMIYHLTAANLRVPQKSPSALEVTAVLIAMASSKVDRGGVELS